MLNGEKVAFLENFEMSSSRSGASVQHHLDTGDDVEEVAGNSINDETLDVLVMKKVVVFDEYLKGVVVSRRLTLCVLLMHCISGDCWRTRHQHCSECCLKCDINAFYPLFLRERQRCELPP